MLNYFTEVRFQINFYVVIKPDFGLELFVFSGFRYCCFITV